MMISPNSAVHPGEFVREDCLKPLGMTVSAAARHLGVGRKAMSELVNGETSLSMDMAIRLSKAFGGDVGMWLGLQLAYDIAHSHDRAARIDVKRVAPGEYAAFA